MSFSNWPINIPTPDYISGKRVIATGIWDDSNEVARSEHERKQDRDEREALELRKLLDDMG